MEQHNTQVPESECDVEEWEHPCPFRGEPTLMPAGKACSACGLRESHINDDAVAPQVPESVTSGMGEGRSLHAAIMNLPCKFEAAWQTPAPSDWVEGYVNGHRDTRHAAAELALRSDAINAELLEALQEVTQLLDMVLGVQGGYPPNADGPAVRARAAIKKATA